MQLGPASYSLLEAKSAIRSEVCSKAPVPKRCAKESSPAPLADSAGSAPAVGGLGDGRFAPLRSSIDLGGIVGFQEARQRSLASRSRPRAKAPRYRTAFAWAPQSRARHRSIALALDPGQSAANNTHLYDNHFLPTHMIKQLLDRIAKYITPPPVTPESLAAYYSSLTDFHLSQVNPAQLTPLARPLWAAEMERRKQARLAARPVAVRS